MHSRTRLFAQNNAFDYGSLPQLIMNFTGSLMPDYVSSNKRLYKVSQLKVKKCITLKKGQWVRSHI